MLTQISLFLSKTTQEDWLQLLAMFVLWAPLVALSYSSFYGATLIILHTVEMSVKQARWLWLVLSVLLALVEGMMWYMFIFMSCLTALGVEMAAITVAALIALYLLGSWWLLHTIRKYGPKEDSATSLG